MRKIFPLIGFTVGAWAWHNLSVAVYSRRFDSMGDPRFRLTHASEIFTTVSGFFRTYARLEPKRPTLATSLVTVMGSLAVLDTFVLALSPKARDRFDPGHFVLGYGAAATALIIALRNSGK